MTATVCYIFLAVGTSAVVYPAASLIDAATRKRAFTVEINLDTTTSPSNVDLVLESSVDTVLKAIDAARR